MAENCKEKRVEKLYNLILDKPEIKTNWPLLENVVTKQDVEDVLNSITELEIWKIYDEIKEVHGIKSFGKGFMYRIVPNYLVIDSNNVKEEDRLTGIGGERYFVNYDKGDKEGNRWFIETPYVIDWKKQSVYQLSTADDARWQGYDFFFRNGFCWTNVLNPNSTYFKCRLKDNTINDVGSMALYDEIEIGDNYYVCIINSYLAFKTMREFFNSSVNITTNDIKKLPIKIPSATELDAFKSKFDECLDIQKQYFNGDLEKAEARKLLKPIELEIDEMVNKLYGITAEFKYEEIEDVEEELELAEIEGEVDE